MAVHRAQRTIERYHQGHLEGAPAPRPPRGGIWHGARDWRRGARAHPRKAGVAQAPDRRAPPATAQSSPSGGIVDREPREAHVDPLAAERDALGFEEPALTFSLGQRPVGAHDALPGNARILAGRHHRAGKAGRART